MEGSIKNQNTFLVPLNKTRLSNKQVGVLNDFKEYIV